MRPFKASSVDDWGIADWPPGTDFAEGRLSVAVTSATLVSSNFPCLRLFIPSWMLLPVR